MTRIQNKEKINILFGFKDIDDNTLQEIASGLIENGVPVGYCKCKYQKLGINQYLSEDKDIDVVIVAEYLESTKPYTPKEFSYILDNYEHITLIPVLVQNHRGDAYIKELYQAGVLNALFQDNASMAMMAQLILKERSRKEARAYYELQDDLNDIIGADIPKCREYIISSNGIEELVDHTRYIRKRVTEREFLIILNGLPVEIKHELKGLEEFMSYFNQDLIVSEVIAEEQKSEPRKTVINKIPIPIPIPVIRKNDVKDDKNASDSSGVDYKKVVVNTLIGFAGIQRRVGTTHQAIIAAHYLQKNNYKVAIVELNESRNKSFDALAKHLNISYSGDRFNYNNVDYYLNFDFSKINTLYSKKYNFIIIDFGIYRNSIKYDLIRCVKQIIVSSYGPWEKENLHKFFLDNSKERLDDNFIYLLQGIVDEQKLEDLNNIKDRLYIAEYQQEIFSGLGNSGIKLIFEPYVKADIDVIIKNRMLDFIKSMRLPTNKNTKKPKVELRGTGVVFLTSLKHGAGCTHLGVAVSNFLTRYKHSTVCFINKNHDTVKDKLETSVRSIEKNSDFDEVYTGFNYLVFDRGILSALNKDELTELKRADYKMLLCLSDDDYLSKLAEFIREMGESAKDWYYIFNILPRGKEKEINKLMQGYKVYCLPIFDDLKLEKPIKSILTDIF